MIGNKINEIEYSRKFLKNLRNLSERIVETASEKEIIFKQNSFDPRLKTHKLSGRDKGCLAFSINDSYRIKFIFLSSREVLCLH
ncbi:type II toxin-antitoxin system mRNA interferase toxin, RelE/StbE family [Patescibacteria group bacterium]|nr:type II toxin-antitoxin system mRNA interferase toxin, RelE/StbE family [Patescibacteria group bacterium]